MVKNGNTYRHLCVISMLSAGIARIFDFGIMVDHEIVVVGIYARPFYMTLWLDIQIFSERSRPLNHSRIPWSCNPWFSVETLSFLINHDVSMFVAINCSNKGQIAT